MPHLRRLRVTPASREAREDGADPALVVGGAVAAATVAVVLVGETLGRLVRLRFAGIVGVAALGLTGWAVSRVSRVRRDRPGPVSPGDRVALVATWASTLALAAFVAFVAAVPHGRALRPIAVGPEPGVHVGLVRALAASQRPGAAVEGAMRGYPQGAHLVAGVVSWATGQAADRSLVATSAAFFVLAALAVASIGRSVALVLLPAGGRGRRVSADGMALAAAAVFLAAPHYGVDQLTVEFRPAQTAAVGLSLWGVARATASARRRTAPPTLELALLGAAVALCHPLFALLVPAAATLASVQTVPAGRARLRSWAAWWGTALLAVALAAATGRGRVGDLLRSLALPAGSRVARLGGTFVAVLFVGAAVSVLAAGRRWRGPVWVPAGTAGVAVLQHGALLLQHRIGRRLGPDVSVAAAGRSSFVAVALLAGLSPVLFLLLLDHGRRAATHSRRDAGALLLAGAASVVLVVGVGTHYDSYHPAAPRLRNPSFEAGTVGWAGDVATRVRRQPLPGFAPDGEAVALVDGPGTGLSLHQDAGGVARVGNRYEATMWVRTANAAPATVTVAVWGLCPDQPQNATTQQRVQDWIRFDVVYEPTRDRCPLRVELYAQAADEAERANDLKLQVDGVTLTQRYAGASTFAPVLPNPGFEYGLTGWHTDPTQPTEVALLVGPGLSHTGRAAGRFRAAAAGTSVSQDTPGNAHPRTRHDARVWLRSTDAGGARVSFVLWSLCPGALRNAGTEVQLGLFWQPVDVALTTHRASCPLRLEVYLRSEAPATFDLDDAALSVPGPVSDVGRVPAG